MRSLVIVLILLISAVSQTSFWPLFGIYGAAPNLVLILILCWIIFIFQKNLSDSQKLWPIISAGLFLDLFSGLPFGVFSLSFIALMHLVDWLVKNIFSRINFWSLALLVLMATFFYNLFLIVSTNLAALLPIRSDAFKSAGFYLIYSIPLEIIYNIILIWLIFYGIKKIFRQKQFI